LNSHTAYVELSVTARPRFQARNANELTLRQGDCPLVVVHVLASTGLPSDPNGYGDTSTQHGDAVDGAPFLSAHCAESVCAPRCTVDPDATAVYAVRPTTHASTADRTAIE
jgi:hypothetical protein